MESTAEWLLGEMHPIVQGVCPQSGAWGAGWSSQFAKRWLVHCSEIGVCAQRVQIRAPGCQMHHYEGSVFVVRTKQSPGLPLCFLCLLPHLEAGFLDDPEASHFSCADLLVSSQAPAGLCP